MKEEENYVYIACSMIKAQKLDFSLLDYLISFVEKQNYLTFVPGKMEKAPPKVVFKRDLNWLQQSNKIIADVNEPSHGVGMEIMYAYEHDIPVICLLNENNKPLSRMVEGCPYVYLILYKDKEELDSKMSCLKLDNIIIEYCNNCGEKTVHEEKTCKKCLKNGRPEAI